MGSIRRCQMASLSSHPIHEYFHGVDSGTAVPRSLQHNDAVGADRRRLLVRANV